ncbi:MAG TPA: hypothetical protein VMY34_11630 [Acidimicrobiales bacterium]|nr:hypothetical protein [Acidimicrobiales bacterium]
MSVDDPGSLVSAPRAVRDSNTARRRRPHEEALRRLASTGGQDRTAIIAMAEELADPITGISQGVRTLIAHEGRLRSDQLMEVLQLVYERAHELHQALIAYERTASARQERNP